MFIGGDGFIEVGEDMVYCFVLGFGYVVLGLLFFGCV